MEARKLMPAQAAAILDVSTRTLRRWSVAFSGSLSEGARRKGRKRSYTSQDMETLQRAGKMIASGLTLAQVSERLPVVDSEQAPSPLTISPEVSIAIGTALERTSRMAESMSDYDVRLDRFERWSRLPWWKRIFTRPVD